MEPSTLSMIAIFISIISAGWTWYYNLSERRTSSVHYVLNLYSEYHSQEMILARRIAWHDLEERMGKCANLTWEMLWKDNADSDQRIYNHLQLVMQFWFQLYALDKLDLLDRKLTLQLFEYQFGMWRDHLTPLAKNTRAHDELQPHVFKSILEKQLDWLSNKG